MPKAKPVQIRGVSYSSMTEAAVAIGVSTHTVWDAVQAGTQDKIGLLMKDASPKPITIRGIEYPSRTAAAKAIGVSKMAIIRAEQFGRLDRIGTRKGIYRE